MFKLSFFGLLFMIVHFLSAQSSRYTISFPNAVHHEAEITASFSNLTDSVVELRMSRTSPGRYALHEFAKNVYGVTVTDSKGNPLKITRPNPYQWNVSGHDGVVSIKYTLYGNRGDGTYSQIDETHAHLNIPATFMYAPLLAENPIEVYFNLREDLDWKVATQLKHIKGNLYFAPNLHYFMDSPVEISNYSLRQFTETSNGKNYTIRFVLHHKGTEAELDEYFENVKKIVQEEKKVYGELPEFDYGEYTFLACYIDNASGDGMEHRNSTILTSTRSLSEGGMKNNIGTVSHEFFHAWNVERIRPKSLNPFNYKEANMSGELWFAEGFTSYYTNLILCRAGIITPKEYIKSLESTFNYVWNSPARSYFNPIEMSYQAPFVDAATSVDPVNRENTFISYYSYGSVLGLALDLSLRNEAANLDLDGYMKLVWNTFGKTETPYTIENLHNALNKYAGKAFGDHFFNTYIYKSKMPDYKKLFESVGVSLKIDDTKAYFGAVIKSKIITKNPKKGTPVYNAGLEKGDLLISFGNTTIYPSTDLDELLERYLPNDEVVIFYNRFGEQRQTKVTLGNNPTYIIKLFEDAGLPPSKEMLKNRKKWLK
ncbi:M61 family metallopeptidase [Leptobacterium sp. I13]|uniref:M61 family metallopeptidase n=1 Tax=Leptobacterium meishanense TaxID=3128904 RepID=UPI0030EE6CD2